MQITTTNSSESAEKALRAIIGFVKWVVKALFYAGVGIGLVIGLTGGTRDIIDTVKVVFAAGRISVEELAFCMKPYIERYIRGLRRMASLAFIAPIIPVIIGIWGGYPFHKDGWPWLISTAGLWTLLWSAILLIFASPLGIVLDQIFRERRINPLKWEAKAYVKFAVGFLLIESSIFAFLTFVPVRNNIWALPGFILLVCTFVLAGIHWGYESKWFRPIFMLTVLALIVIHIIGFFKPGLTAKKGYEMVKSAGVNAFSAVKSRAEKKEVKINDILWRVTQSVPEGVETFWHGTPIPEGVARFQPPVAGRLDFHAVYNGVACIYFGTNKADGSFAGHYFFQTNGLSTNASRVLPSLTSSWGLKFDGKKFYGYQMDTTGKYRLGLELTQM